MKFHSFPLAAALLLLLSGCAGPASSAPSSGPLPSPTALEAGVWPSNAYTEGLPVPPGEVAWALLDTARDNCSVHLTGMTQQQYDDYMSLLVDEGFSVLESTSETPQGQDYVSIGTILSDGEKELSVSFLPDSFTLYISLAS